MHDFVQEWEKAYNDWDGKFSAKAIEPIRTYNDGFSTRCFEPKVNFWFHIWNGPHCIFGRTELIPGVTLVTGVKCEPMFYTPQEFIEKFEFTGLNPFTQRPEEKGSFYQQCLEKLKQQILNNAKV